MEKSGEERNNSRLPHIGTAATVPNLFCESNTPPMTTPNLHSAFPSVLLAHVASFAFFRAASVDEAMTVISRILLGTDSANQLPCSPYQALVIGVNIMLLLTVEWLGTFPRLKAIFCRNIFVRWAFYLAIFSMIAIFGRVSANEFIYFQF